jgi:hypothetical protein
MSSRFAPSLAGCLLLAMLAPACAWAGVTKIGSSGTAAGQFSQVAGVASDSAGNVYAVDTGGNRVEKFAPDGKFLQSFGSSGSGDGQLNSPADVALDSAGNVYVADKGNSRIEKFAPDGAFVAAAGAQGTGPGFFQNLTAVAVDAAGNVYTLDQARIQKFDGSGNFQWASQPFGSIMGLAVNPAGEVYTDDLMQHLVRRLTTAGADDGSVPPPPDGRAFTPQDVSVDHAGGLLVWNSTLNEVDKFDPAGAFQSSWTPSGNMPRTPAGGARAQAAQSPPPPPPPGGGSSNTTQLGQVAEAPNGGAYVAASGLSNQVLRLDPTSPDVVSFETINDNPLVTQTQHMLRARASVPFGSVSAYAFDSDGDGSFETAATIDALGGMAKVVYGQAGRYNVRVRATAAGGGSVDSGPLDGPPFLDVRPKPPPGTVGVSINGGADYTNSPKVQLAIVWPRLSLQVFVANDGGFAGASGQTLSPSISWTLRSTGPERLPKTVYVRFEGVPNDVLPGGAQVGGPSATYTDDIILDQTAPILESASLAAPPAATAARTQRFRVRLRAKDGNSGVAMAQFRAGHKRLAPVKFRRRLAVNAARAPSAASRSATAATWPGRSAPYSEAMCVGFGVTASVSEIGWT